MGLAQRRAVATFRDENFPEWKKRIDEAARFEVPVDVVWDALAETDLPDQLSEFLPKVYFEPLVGALAAITIDDLGATALREGLTGIVITNVGGNFDAGGFSFGGGVLTLDHRPDTNVDYGDERRSALQRLLEDGL